MLTEEQVRGILKDARPQRQIAFDYDTSQANVSMIKSRLTWSQVHGKVVLTTNEKLLPTEVRAIRNDPRSTSAIADDYDVSSTTIWNVQTRRHYAHVA